MTQANPTGQAAKTEPRKQDVIREFKVFDELPPRPARKSELEDMLEEVKTKAPGKFVCIGQYNTPAAATGAANNLRNRHGSSLEVDGWEFKTRKLEGDRTGLFVHYDGSGIKLGLLDTHRSKVAAAAKKASEKQAAKKAEKAKK